MKYLLAINVVRWISLHPSIVVGMGLFVLLTIIILLTLVFRLNSSRKEKSKALKKEKKKNKEQAAALTNQNGEISRLNSLCGQKDTQISDLGNNLSLSQEMLARKGQELETAAQEIQAHQEEITRERQHIGDLENEMARLQEGFVTLQNSLAEKDGIIENIRNQNASLTSELNNSETLANEQRQRANQLSRQLNAYRTNFANARRAREDLQTQFTEETTRLRNELAANEEESLALQNQINSILAEKDELANRVNGLNTTIIQKDDEIRCKDETIENLTREKIVLEEEIAQQERALQSLQREKDAIKNEADKKQEQLIQKDAEIERLNDSLAQLEEVSRRNQLSADEKRELEEQIQRLQENLADSSREKEILDSQLKQKENDIRDIGNSLTRANERINEIQEALADANTIINAQKLEIQRLKDSIINQHPDEDVPKEPKEQEKEPDSEGDMGADEPDEPKNDDDNGNIDNPEETIPKESKGQGDETPQPNEEPDETNITPRTGTHVKSKEEEAIEKSGNSMMDFPPIINDSNKHVQRSIEYVYDKDGERIYANDFFGGTAEEIARKSRQLEEAGLMGRNDFICGMCHRPVKIAHRTINGIESLFFAHAIRNEYCAWIPYSTSPKDIDIPIDTDFDVDGTGDDVATKPHSRILKEMVFSLLCTRESEELGVSDVKCDAIIRSTVPYMKWRRPDISFKYKDRDVVIVMQRKKHDLRMLVDRDVFFRLNYHHVIWIFGADNDISYDYMRGSNYKNTLFDCHRNVFVFDKEAQQKSEEKNTLCLKYNWLDENDNWAVTQSDSGSNGLIADISNFIFDDEYCKPYIREANEPYFNLHPDAKEQFLATRKTREQLLKEFEEKWKGEPSYEEAQREMKLRNDKVTPFQYMGLWGFRFNTTTLIQPVFTEQPEDLNNGFFMVKQGETAGIVNYYGEMVMDWTILECEKLSVDISNNHVLFMANGLWGVADFKGNILIKPQFVAIKPWSDTIYRVRTYNLWGLQNIEDKTVAECLYTNIGELVSGKAEATLRDKDRSWITYKGILDSNGNAIDSNTSKLNDKYIAFEQFEKWGVRTIDEQNVITPSYKKIIPWTEESIRVKDNGKWGVIGLPDGNIIIGIKYDSISELEDGRAKVIYVGVTHIVDANGNIQSEKSIKLQNGFVKSKIGEKWGIEKDGNEIVPHKYDEIGSFRQRLIGVINSSIVKLNAYYDYPIRISGRCSGIATNGVKVNISGVSCYLPNSFIKNAGLEGKINPGKILDNIAFGNLIFSQKQYLLRIVSESQMLKRMSHGDKDSDFSMNEIVTGTITNIMRYKTKDGIKTTKVKLKLPDGRETMVPRRFFVAAGLNISDYNRGDNIQIQKIGFDDELDQTTWNIKGTSHANS